MSAGIKGVVTETVYLIQAQESIDLAPCVEYCMTPEIYDSTNTIIGFTEPSITTTNKNMFVSHEKYTDVKKGVNAIVMGDMLDDIKIVKDLELGTVISIGFYNTHEGAPEAELKKYMETFDIVITNDGNMTHAAELVKSVTGLPRDPEYKSYGPSAYKFAAYFD